MNEYIELAKATVVRGWTHVEGLASSTPAALLIELYSSTEWLFINILVYSIISLLNTNINTNNNNYQIDLTRTTHN